ncbi:MAG: carbohydrate-binding domain-containing protein [Treponema sp.]|nr:carbohydrate-binding domain-containing protein [Treponema sp.]
MIHANPSRLTIDEDTSRIAYGVDLIITPEAGVTRGRRLIIIEPKAEGTEYTLSGYFNGQIISKTKNTVLKLNGVYIEQNCAKAALRCQAKTEIKAVADTENYIVSSGRSFLREGALHGKRDLILGGSGTLHVKGAVWHGIEGDDVKIKGSGTIYAEGSRRGAALACESLAVEPDKTFTAYLLNAKTGIKAKDEVKVESGTFCIYDNDCAIKADSIHLSGGLFRIVGNRQVFISRKGTANQAGATIVFDDSVQPQ